MKKVKIAFWLVLIGFLASLGYQNWDFFMEPHGLRINLLFVKYSAPELPNAILFLVFFVAGFVISYFITLIERFKSKRTIKTLNNTLETNQKLLDEMKNELQLLKGEPPANDTPHVAPDQPKAKDSDVP